MTTVDAARGPAQVPAEAGLSDLRRPGLTITRLEGDLDIATVPALRERLLGVLGPGVRLLVIDLSGVSFCDVAGLAVLIGTQRRARARGITVRLAAPRPQMAKLLRITGLDHTLTICATLDDARAPGETGMGLATAPGEAMRGSRNVRLPYPELPPGSRNRTLPGPAPAPAAAGQQPGNRPVTSR